jgi:hypothetical protein
MAREKRCGQMELFIRVTIKMVKRKEKVNLFGLMVLPMKETSVITIFMV